MKLFAYVVKDKDGNVTKGTVEAETKESLIQHFHKQQQLIFSISETKVKPKKKAHRGVKTDDLVVFSRQFTTLIESGIPVVECLGILESQVETAYFKSVITDSLREVKEGASLSAAFKKHKDVFPDIYLSMVEAAEASGNLPDILNRVSVYLEKSSALRKKVLSALYYPVVIILMAIAITGFLVFKVIPTFKEIFASLGGVLPLPTQILIAFSDFIRKPVILLSILGILIIVSFIFKRYIRTDKGKRNFHKMLLKLPVFGELIRKMAIAKFSRTFATLAKSGVSIMNCLDIVAKTSGNKIIEEAVLASKKSIQEGQPISVPLERTGVFPPMVVKMVAIGERSGRLEEMLSKIAQFYEEQTDAMVAGLASLIEPMVIAFLGVVVGGIVVSLFLPIIKITQYIGGMH
ncbi:MAG: type II secretion system F family protein [Candidatus Omnitrophica bacterium]|nr:type II secretion system F family protein [Candidatus Omnitrophota bacterium]MDD5429972.1 type II secretion system F family protein [Candidatus Omnitrophota bacterium]